MSAKDLFFKTGYEFNRADARAYAREELIYNVTEDLLVQMEDLSVSKVELARRLGKSRAYISQMLKGSRNMTLASLSDICFALGLEPRIELHSEASSVDHIKPVHSFATTNWKTDEKECTPAHAIVLGKNVIDRRNPAQWEKVA
ncbi:helix-turn-helix domain-containing protein [Nitrincola tapanii]|nr:helix-turn-helix transcriptional regulator [Nitrincola tapanii]